MKNSANNITKLSVEDLHNQVSQTDWERVKAMSDVEINTTAQSDPDALPLDDAFFKHAKRMPPA